MWTSSWSLDLLKISESLILRCKSLILLLDCSMYLWNYISRLSNPLKTIFGLWRCPWSWSWSFFWIKKLAMSSYFFNLLLGYVLSLKGRVDSTSEEKRTFCFPIVFLRKRPLFSSWLSSALAFSLDSGDYTHSTILFSTLFLKRLLLLFFFFFTVFIDSSSSACSR